MSSIGSAYATIESEINEFLSDFSQGIKPRTEPYDRSDIDSLNDLWDRAEDENRGGYMKPLQRYQESLKTLEYSPFDRGKAPYQDVDDLRVLRNALLHHKPMWQSASSEDHRVAKRLEGKDFDLNPFTSKGNPFFPDKCLSAGCTNWALEAVRAFIREFYDRIPEDEFGPRFNNRITTSNPPISDEDPDSHE